MRKADIQAFRTSFKSDLFSEKFFNHRNISAGLFHDFITDWIILLLSNAFDRPEILLKTNPNFSEVTIFNSSFYILLPFKI